jgi:hypothetical protein
MTTAIFSAGPNVTNDTSFRTWGSAFSTALATVGMVKTADTGQINWTTVTVPGTNIQAGYEIWRFNDSLQATAPLFLRVGYGTGSSNCCSFWWTIGKGSDGAGNITGVLQTVTQNQCSMSIGTGVTNWYLSSGDGSMLTGAPALATVDAASTCMWFFALDRSRDSSGVATATGAWFVRNSSAAVLSHGYNYAATANKDTLRIPASIPQNSGTNTSLAAGGKAPLFAAVATDGAGNLWQPRSVLVGMRTDVGVGSPITVPGWGTYLPTGAASQECLNQTGTFASACLGWW